MSSELIVVTNSPLPTELLSQDDKKTITSEINEKRNHTGIKNAIN